VLPIYNEDETVLELHRRLTAALAGIDGYEIVFVDDRSTDDSWNLLHAIAQRDEHVRAVRLSRNFGHQRAITAGLELAHGRAVVLMDGDLQDPPEVIPALFARFGEGYDVVYAVRSERSGESWFKRVTATVFYRTLRRMAQVDIPRDTGDFRLLSRRVADVLVEMPEQARFLRGMTAWIGFRQTGVPYARDARHAGRTNFTVRTMLRFAADAIVSFSTLPLRLASTLGFLVVGICAIVLAYTVYLKFFTDRTVQGFTTVTLLVAFLGGIQLLAVGILGQYVARIFDETKRRPLFVVDEVVDGALLSDVPQRPNHEPPSSI
jgi:glycosyltransferase involved in cell wall biosynthesis